MNFWDGQAYCQENDMDVVVVTDHTVVSSLENFIQSHLNKSHDHYMFTGYVEKYKEGEWIDVLTEEVCSIRILIRFSLKVKVNIF